MEKEDKSELKNLVVYIINTVLIAIVFFIAGVAYGRYNTPVKDSVIKQYQGIANEYIEHLKSETKSPNVAGNP